MSVRVTLNCHLQSECASELFAFLDKNLPNVRSFKGNEYVKVLIDNDNDEMLLDEQWRSVEAHQAYIQCITDSGVLQQLGQFLTQPPTIKYFNAVAI